MNLGPVRSPGSGVRGHLVGALSAVGALVLLGGFTGAVVAENVPTDVGVAVSANPTIPAVGRLELGSDPLMRVGVPFRLTVTADAALIALPDPLILGAVLERGGVELASCSVALTSGAALRAGAVLPLVADRDLPANVPPRIVVSLCRLDGRELARSALVVESPDRLRTAVAQARPATPTVAVLDRLRLLQATELLADEPVAVGDWRQAQAHLDQVGQSALISENCIECAVLDPVDQAILPLRIHLPPGPSSAVKAVAVLAAPAGPCSRSRWPLPPGSWLAAARTAGVAVVEPYPAGDGAWEGITPRRLPLVLEEARRHLSTAVPWTVITADAAADGGAQGAARGQSVIRNLTLLQTTAQALADPATWNRPGSPPPAERDHPAGRLADYADGPFVVVVGTAEHAAARADNRRLADQFASAWERHTHGRPPVVVDTAFDPAAWAQATWVLVGNPRSNRVLADLNVTLPASWDFRTVRLGGSEVHRSLAPAIAVAVADPRRPNRSLLILDGRPAWSTGLPFLAEAATADALLLTVGNDPVRLLLAPLPSAP